MGMDSRPSTEQARVVQIDIDLRFVICTSRIPIGFCRTCRFLSIPLWTVHGQSKILRGTQLKALKGLFLFCWILPGVEDDRNVHRATSAFLPKHLVFRDTGWESDRNIWTVPKQGTIVAFGPRASCSGNSTRHIWWWFYWFHGVWQAPHAPHGTGHWHFEISAVSVDCNGFGSTEVLLEKLAQFYLIINNSKLNR